MITQTELQSQLHYNTETGIFTWIKSKKGIFANTIAGTKRKNGYIIICINQKDYRAHRLAWLYMHGYIPEYIDHINGVKDDNCLSNLRPATKQQNAYNSKVKSTNTSGVKGVCYNKEKNKWKAYIKANSKQIHLLYTNDFFEACCQSFSAINKYHKEFANKR